MSADGARGSVFCPGEETTKPHLPAGQETSHAWISRLRRAGTSVREAGGVEREKRTSVPQSHAVRVGAFVDCSRVVHRGVMVN